MDLEVCLRDRQGENLSLVSKPPKKKKKKSSQDNQSAGLGSIRKLPQHGDVKGGCTDASQGKTKVAIFLGTFTDICTKIIDGIQRRELSFKLYIIRPIARVANSVANHKWRTGHESVATCETKEL
jgi:hypothetical protein